MVQRDCTKEMYFCQFRSILHLKSEGGETVHPEEILELPPNQEETDSRVVLYLNYAKQNITSRLLFPHQTVTSFS